MGKFLTDAYVIGKNELLVQLRNPLWLFFGLFQPVVYLTLFSPFLSGIANSPGFPGGSAIQFFAPGLLIMNVMFGAGFAGFGLIGQLRSGFIERIRVTPVSRVAIALGFILRTPIVILIQGAILIFIAWLFFGLQIHALGTIILAILLALIGVMMASLSFTIALIVKDEGTLAAVTNFFTLPLMLLSGVMLPVAFAPKLLQTLSKFDPFTHAVDAARNLMNGNLSHSSIGVAFMVFIILGTITINWFISSLREAVA